MSDKRPRGKCGAQKRGEGQGPSERRKGKIFGGKDIDYVLEKNMTRKRGATAYTKSVHDKGEN